MDAAYDAKRINETSRQFGHVPIIDKNSRGREVIPMAPHEAERYKTRSIVEWANGRLKEDFGRQQCHGKRALQGNPAFNVRGYRFICRSAHAPALTNHKKRKS